MEVLIDDNKTIIATRQADLRVDSRLPFEREWRVSISGDEFVQKAHRHIDEIYDSRKK